MLGFPNLSGMTFAKHFVFAVVAKTTMQPKTE
jgi:hypothetical protein